MPGKEPKKIPVGLILSWIFGVIFIFGGLGALFSKEFIGAFALFIMGSILIPPLNRFISNKIKFELSSKRIKVLIIIVGFVIIGIFSDITSEETIQDTATQNVGQLTSEKSSETTKIQTKQAGTKLCEEFSDDKIKNIKYDFWDIETNNKIEQCLDTSPNIEFIDITNDRFTQTYPSVFGNYVVWEDYRNGKSDIYLYDISTQEIKRITDNKGEDFKPIIRNNLVLFHDQYDEDLLNPIPNDKNNMDYWRNELFIYDIGKDQFIPLGLHHDTATIDKEYFNGDYLIKLVIFYDFIYFVSDKIKDNSIELKEEAICDLKACSDVKRTGLSCLYSDELCEIDDSDLSNFGRNFQDKYLVGGTTILNLATGDYYQNLPPYKQVKDNYAIEYQLRWRLENLAIIDLKGQKPLIYNTNIPKDILSQYDNTLDIFNICLKKHRDMGGEWTCDKWRNYVRIYDFKKDKYYTIKGNLWEIDNPTSLFNSRKILVEEGDFDIDKFAGNIKLGSEGIFIGAHGLFRGGIYNIHKVHKELDFYENKFVWTYNNDITINNVNFPNTDIKLAVIK